MVATLDNDPELEDLLGFFDFSYRPKQYTGSVGCFESPPSPGCGRS